MKSKNYPIKGEHMVIIFMTQKENDNLENLVTHWSEKFWLSHDCPYACLSVYLYANTFENRRVESTLLLIDSCHNKLSTDQYNIAIPQTQVESSLRLHDFLKLTADQYYYWPVIG